MLLACWVMAHNSGMNLLSGSWDLLQLSQSIAYKELFPIVIAAYVW